MKINHRKARVIYAILAGVILATEILIACFVRDRFIRPYGGDILITASLLGLSVALILPLSNTLSTVCGIAAALLLLTGLLAFYFYECIKVYGVLIDQKDSSFNFAFKNAWFLHFFVS